MVLLLVAAALGGCSGASTGASDTTAGADVCACTADASVADTTSGADLLASDDSSTADGGLEDAALGDRSPGDGDLTPVDDAHSDVTSADDEQPDLAPGDDVQGVDPLAALSDEFDDAATVTQWKRLYQVEGWPHDQLEGFDIDASRAGWLMMMPYSSTWYQDYRGVLMFKRLSGNFVVTTSLEVRNRAGNGAPAASYSLGGIFVRAPRDEIHQPSDWTAGNPQSEQLAGENYMFLSLGSANQPGVYQTEVKRTRNSDSQLEIGPGQGSAQIRVARIGSYFIMLIRYPGGAWQIHRRYSHTLMPPTLQVGLTTYTDWDSVQRVYPGNPYGHNTSPLPLDDQTTPDLVARFDYVRFRTPAVPAELVSLDLTNQTAVPDSVLLAFLGFD
ncbi:MAG: hypothetical protein KC609_00665 [Myxococcales bacterium]|nr:hypothetical protein [Myxococcales bacterium]